MKTSLKWTGSCVVLAAALSLGCEPSAGPTAEPNHDHTAAAHGDHDHAEPKTYGEAVAALKSLASEVSTHLASNNAEELKEVDHPLHEIIEIGEKVPSLAKEAKLDEAALEAIDSAVDNLLNAMTKVHEGVGAHSGEAKAFDYKSVEGDVDSALSTLGSYVPAAPTP